MKTEAYSEFSGVEISTIEKSNVKTETDVKNKRQKSVQE